MPTALVRGMLMTNCAFGHPLADAQMLCPVCGLGPLQASSSPRPALDLHALVGSPPGQAAASSGFEANRAATVSPSPPEGRSTSRGLLVRLRSPFGVLAALVLVVAVVAVVLGSRSDRSPATRVSSASNTFPPRDGVAVDTAGVLTGATKTILDTQLTNYAQRTGNQVVVAVVPSLNGITVESYALSLFNSWGIGQRGKNNGVLLLIAVQDHKDRIEVGRGLESQLTNAMAADILNRSVTPLAAQGRLGDALVAGEQAIRRALSDPTPET